MKLLYSDSSFDMSVFAIVGTTHRYLDSRIRGLLDTWYQDIDGYLISTDAVVAEPGFICTTTKTDYHSHALKIRNAICQAAPRVGQFDWYVISCDNIYMNVTNLKKYLTGFSPELRQAHGLVINTHPGDPTLYYISTGAGLVLSRASMRALVLYLERTPNPQTVGVIDVDIGFYMRELEITLCNDTRFNGERVSPASDIVNQISSHCVESDAMREMHGYIHKG